MDLEGCYVKDKSTNRKKNEHKYETINSKIMGIAMLWYYRGMTSMELLISCSHRGMTRNCKKS